MSKPLKKDNVKAYDKYHQKVAKLYVDYENHKITLGQLMKRINIGNQSNLWHILNNNMVKYYIHNFRWLGHCGHNLSTCYVREKQFILYENNK